MRATRAYLASLGTTGLLVLAAFTILIAASALLTFNGWPGGGDPERPTPVLIDPGRDLAPTGGPAEVAEEAAAAADEVAALVEPAPAGGGAPGGDAPTGSGPGDGAPDGPRQPGPDQPTDSAPPGGENGDGDDPEQPFTGIELPGGGSLLPGGDLSFADGLADGLESTTTFLGDDAVGQLSPQLGSAVTDTGQLLTDIVRALDGTPAQAR